MHTKWAPFCLGLALGLAGAREVRAEPATTNAAVKAKPRPKTPAKSGKVQTRAPGPPKAPSESVRRAVSATNDEASKGVESPELTAIREADRELFPPPGPPVGIPWPN